MRGREEGTAEMECGRGRATWDRGRGSYSHPLHVVFRLLLNEVDAFQHVGDVIDPSLLHLQHLRCLVQIQDPVRGLAQ